MEKSIKKYFTAIAGCFTLGMAAGITFDRCSAAFWAESITVLQNKVAVLAFFHSIPPDFFKDTDSMLQFQPHVSIP